jgi:1,2-diacylglycerol 3-alpha-glucosyltransferase
MKKKIAIVTEIIAPYRIPVFNALAAHADIDLQVIFLSETDPTLRQWRVYKNEINFSYEVLPSRRIRVGGLNLLFNSGLAAALEKFSPGAVICGGYNYAASWQALRWARRRKIRFVLWSESNQQDARSRHKPIEVLKEQFFRRCDGFVVPGKSASAYLQSFAVDAKRISTAPNAVDNVYFAARSEKVKSQPDAFRAQLALPPRYILFVGRLVREKGVFDLLEAYTKLAVSLRSEIGVVFAGSGPAEVDLSRRAKSISPGMICFPGFTQREDLAGVYALAELLVLPTYSDPWGLVVNEAMACGLPIIVSNVAGCAADLVEDGWNGFVVQSNKTDNLAVAIDTVLRQPDLRLRMGMHGLDRIRSYSPAACAEGLLASARGELQ